MFLYVGFEHSSSQGTGLGRKEGAVNVKLSYYADGNSLGVCLIEWNSSPGHYLKMTSSVLFMEKRF